MCAALMATIISRKSSIEPKRTSGTVWIWGKHAKVHPEQESNVCEIPQICAHLRADTTKLNDARTMSGGGARTHRRGSVRSAAASAMFKRVSGYCARARAQATERDIDSHLVWAHRVRRDVHPRYTCSLSPPLGMRALGCIFCSTKQIVLMSILIIFIKISQFLMSILIIFYQNMTVSEHAGQSDCTSCRQHYCTRKWGLPTRTGAR